MNIHDHIHHDHHHRQQQHHIVTSRAKTIVLYYDNISVLQYVLIEQGCTTGIYQKIMILLSNCYSETHKGREENKGRVNPLFLKSN